MVTEERASTQPTWPGTLFPRRRQPQQQQQQQQQQQTTTKPPQFLAPTTPPTATTQRGHAMARTHSSYTGSPTRIPSPARSGSADGSQYEMDLDALGLDSTFESTALDGSAAAPVDRVDSSAVEGPDDFTMNMTYWMTADLQPPAVVHSRKEKSRAREKDRLKERDRERAREAAQSPPAATRRIDASSPSHVYSTPASQRSMAHDEKVRSFLSALPDATSPLRAPLGLLHLPRPSPPKARPMQPTVEDGDTPRKPTQQTVIHRPETEAETEPETTSQPQSRPQPQPQSQQHHTRITELEAILAYTRTELDTLRNDTYKQKDHITTLERSLHLKTEENTQLKAQETALIQKAEQNAQLLTQCEHLQQQLSELQDAKRSAVEDASHANQRLEGVSSQLAQLRQSHEQNTQKTTDAHIEQQNSSQQTFAEERSELHSKLASVQLRADTLQADLARVTAEAKAARERSQTQASANAEHHLSRISSLETQLQDANFSLECAQADIAAKAQLFQTNIALNASLRLLRGELETQRANNPKPREESVQRQQLTPQDHVHAEHVVERGELERQLNTAQGRIASLDSSHTTLRAQLADAHREIGSARSDIERLTHDLEDANDRLLEARAEADRRISDVEKKLAKMKDMKNEAETTFRELKSQHNDLVEGHAAMLEDVRDKAEDAVRKTGSLLAQERKEKVRLKKEVEQLQSEVDQLRTTQGQNTTEDELDNATTPTLPSQKDQEIADLRAIIKTQVSQLKTLKSTHASSLTALTTAHEQSLTTLHAQIATLTTRLATQAHDHAAVNAALDEQLALVLSKLMKERARSVVGRRDGQWEEVQRCKDQEKELLGKVLMRQWGREDCGVSDKKGKGKQIFEYQFVKR